MATAVLWPAAAAAWSCAATLRTGGSVDVALSSSEPLRSVKLWMLLARGAAACAACAARAAAAVYRLAATLAAAAAALARLLATRSAAAAGVGGAWLPLPLLSPAAPGAALPLPAVLPPAAAARSMLLASAMLARSAPAIGGSAGGASANFAKSPSGRGAAAAAPAASATGAAAAAAMPGAGPAATGSGRRSSSATSAGSAAIASASWKMSCALRRAARSPASQASEVVTCGRARQLLSKRWVGGEFGTRPKRALSASPSAHPRAPHQREAVLAVEPRGRELGQEVGLRAEAAEHADVARLHHAHGLQEAAQVGRLLLRLVR